MSWLICFRWCQLSHFYLCLLSPIARSSVLLHTGNAWLTSLTALQPAPALSSLTLNQRRSEPLWDSKTELTLLFWANGSLFSLFFMTLLSVSETSLKPASTVCFLSHLPAWACAKSPQLCPTLCDAMDCSPPSSSVHGTFQAGILERVAMAASRESSWPGD